MQERGYQDVNSYGLNFVPVVSVTEHSMGHTSNKLSFQSSTIHILSLIKSGGRVRCPHPTRKQMIAVLN